MEQFCPIYYTTPANINTPGQPNIIRLFRNTADNLYYVKKSDGTIELFMSGGAGTPITLGVIPQGTGPSIADGTWHFEGNNLVPNVSGSNLGSPTNRINTIYLDSIIDYLTDINFRVGALVNFTFTNSSLFGVGIVSPMASIHNHSVLGDNDSTPNAYFENSNGDLMFTIWNGGSVDMGFNPGGNFGSVGIGIPHVGTSRLTIRGLTNNNTTFNLTSTDINDIVHFAVRDDGHIFMPNLPVAAAGLAAGELWNNAGVVNVI